MKIVRLAAENVKRLCAVEIKPDGSLVVIGGKNGAGKTSVLDSIMYALAGTKSIPSKPIRTGAKAGQIVVELDGDPPMTVTRKLTAAGGSLEIKTADGFKAPSPQKILDELCGKVAFDPLAFTRMKPRDQIGELRALVGLDFSAVDTERKQLYDERTIANRQAKTLEAQTVPVVPLDTPDEEVSVSDLVNKLVIAQDDNTTTELHQQNVTSRQTDLDRLQATLTKAETMLAQAEAKLAERPPIVDTAAIEQEIAAAEKTNEAVRAKQERKRLVGEYAAFSETSAALTDRIDQIDANKAAQLAGAEWPVPGLGFDEDGVTLNGLPFEQASSAEQLRVSVAMGLAVNPTLRVLLIRDGSLLDDEGLRMVAELAAERDGQVWIERVGEGAECSVVIEDGHVK